MTYQFTPLFILFIINGSIAIAFALFGWTRRLNPGGRPFAFLMLAIGEWSLTRALEAAAVEPAGKIFWGQVEYFGIATAGLLWLLFAAEFARKSQWLTKKRLILLGVIPALTIGMAFTNSLHGLIWTSITPDITPGSDLLIYRHGLWFWVAVAYNYTTFIVGTVLLLTAFRHYTRLYRLQAVLIVIAALLPMAGNALYISRLSPLPGLDLTHFGFTGAALIFSITVFRYKMFDLRRLARDIVIEEMSDGIVVIDEHSRIIDLNPAAKRMFGSPAFLALGMSVENAAIIWFELTATRPTESGDLTEINLGDRTYRVNVSPLSDHTKRVRGRVLFIVDVTEEKQAREIIRKSEEHFRDLYEHAPGAYFSVGADGIIRLCNERAVELLGSAREQLTGRSIFDFFADTTNGRRVAKKIYEDSRAGNAAADRELEMQRADGTVVWVSLTVRPTIAADGRVAEYRSMAADITRRKQSERERELLISQLRRSVQEIKKLSGLLSVCSNCKRIRDEKGNWTDLEDYVSRHSKADLSHGTCPDCREKTHPGTKKKG